MNLEDIYNQLEKLENDLEYDKKWIEEIYLPNFNILEKCLIKGTFPKKENENEISNK